MTFANLGGVHPSRARNIRLLLRSRPTYVVHRGLSERVLPSPRAILKSSTAPVSKSVRALMVMARRSVGRCGRTSPKPEPEISQRRASDWCLCFRLLVFAFDFGAQLLAPIAREQDRSSNGCHPQQQLHGLNPRRMPQIQQARAVAAALTAYDYPTAFALRAGDIDICLVGDSLAYVALGFSTTQMLLLPALVHRAQAVQRCWSCCGGVDLTTGALKSRTEYL
ncbi:unnamed protein product [Tilletia controversa]|nr:unnamed protein product [Tilletia controversa]